MSSVISQAEKQQFYPQGLEEATSQTPSNAEAWEACSQYTLENLSPNSPREIWLQVLLPPVPVNGQFIKGIALSNGVDLLAEAHPNIQTLFHLIADSQGAGYPWSEKADALLGHYPNPAREKWFYKTEPQRKQQILVGLQAADMVNTNLFRPQLGERPIDKTLDILCLDPAHSASNLPALAQGLKAFRQLYPKLPIKLHWYFNGPADVDLKMPLPRFQPENDPAMAMEHIYRQLETQLRHPQDYIVLHEGRPTAEQRCILYNQARFTVSGLCLGPKHPYLTESAMANTPCLWQTGYHRYLLPKKADIFPKAVGLHRDLYQPEAWAEAVLQLLTQPHQFSPRLALLPHSGKRHVLNQCLEALPFYAEHLPQFEPGATTHHENLPLSLALHNMYERETNNLMEYHSEEGSQLLGVTGLANIAQLVQFYMQRCRRWL